MVASTLAVIGVASPDRWLEAKASIGGDSAENWLSQAKKVRTVIIQPKSGESAADVAALLGAAKIVPSETFDPTGEPLPGQPTKVRTIRITPEPDSDR